MAGTNFEFHIKGIGSLLKVGRLAVPLNQRSYMWSDEHVRALLQDFDEAISNDDDDYFLGTIVLVQHEREDPSIADGQQRLATTTILFARIRDLLATVSREIAANSVDTDFVRSIDRDTEQLLPRLTLNAEDHDFFFRRVIPNPGESQGRHVEATRQSHRRLIAASEIVTEFLSDKLKPLRKESHADWLLKWVKFVEFKASVVVVTVPDEVGAFRIFETLNDRGLRAGQADILKNYFFSKAAKRIVEAQTMWSATATGIESLGEDEGDEKLITYIRHFWVTTHGPTKERELAAQIKLEIGGETKTIEFLSDASASVQIYLALWNPKHSKWSDYKSSVRRNVETISEHLQVKQIRPLMFAVALHFDKIEAEKAFKLFVTWSVRFLIFGGRGGMLDQQYSLRAQEVGLKKITTARALRDAMQKYVPSDKEFEEAFATARVSRAHLARYYLRAIEKTLTDDPQPEYVANEDVQDITLEHILPFEPTADWGVDEETARAGQKLLGNMVLLKADQNRDVGNSDFVAKQRVYADSGYYVTKSVATTRVCEPSKWTMQDIRNRQTELAKLAVKTWTLSFAD
jgi:hypothetical protein